MSYRRLEYTGGVNPFAGPGITHFAAQIRAKVPNITDRGVSEVVMRMVNQYDPREKRRSVVLWGEDIMTEDPETIHSWDLVAPRQKAILLAHPHDVGERIDPENEKAVEMQRLDALPRNAVNRSFLIHPPGLKMTYCWRKASATPWVQEVTEHDYHVILDFRDSQGRYVFRRLFQDPDIRGPYVDVRAFDYDKIVKERHAARTVEDVRALENHFQRKPHHQGVTLKQE